MKNLSLLILALMMGCAGREIRITEYEGTIDVLGDGVKISGCRITADGAMPDNLIIKFDGEDCQVTMP